MASSFSDLAMMELGEADLGEATKPPKPEVSHPQQRRNIREKAFIHPSPSVLGTYAGFEEDSGSRYLAGVKNYDSRFNFYPCFPMERSMVLDFRAEEVHYLRIEMHAQRDEIKTRYNVLDPSCLPLTNKHRKKFMKCMSLLADKIEKYNMAFVNSKIVHESYEPDVQSADKLLKMIEARSESQYPQYWSENTLDFRLLEPRTGYIENAVKNIMPCNRIGRWFLRPFRSSIIRTTDIEFEKYGDEILSFIAGTVTLLGICVFLILPLALLSFFESNHVIKTVVVLVMCGLVSVLARAIETNEARQIILVCGYSAIMSGFLSQSTTN